VEPPDETAPVPHDWYRYGVGGPYETGAFYRSVTGFDARRVLSERGVACWPDAGDWILDADLHLLHIVQDGSVVRWSRLVDAP
jgi:hypothetical protein